MCEFTYLFCGLFSNEGLRKVMDGRYVRVRIQGCVVLVVCRRRRLRSWSCVLVLSGYGIFSVHEQLGLDLYPIHLYRNLWNTKVEDEGNAQKRGVGGRKMDFGWQLEV